MKTVLIADDSLFMRTLLKKVLQQNNHRVIAEAANGQEAIELYINVKPDITLLDITMPKVNGLIALKEIMTIDQKAIVIMCSALGSHGNIIESLRMGAKDFIVKPNFDRLAEILTKLDE